MSQISLNVHVGSFQPMTNKAGKITATAEKIAHALNLLDGRGLVGAALTGRGSIAKQARILMSGDADTLSGLLARNSIDGSEWGNLRGLLIAEFGASMLNRETMKGKRGAVAYIEAVQVELRARFLKAETEKASENAANRLQFAAEVGDAVARLFAVSEAARIEAEQAAVNGIAALLDDTADTVTDDTQSV